MTNYHMTPEEFDEIKRDIKYDFKHDNYFSELKENEILNERINTANALDAFVGKYFSVDWVKRNVFKQTEDEITQMQGQMEDEADQSTEMDAALADPADGTNGIDGEKGPPSD